LHRPDQPPPFATSHRSLPHPHSFPTRRSSDLTQLACRFNGRTAQPLGPTTAPGCDEPTSRCQTSPSMCTLEADTPALPGVAFIRCAMALPSGTTGALSPTFHPPRLVGLAVKLP